MVKMQKTSIWVVISSHRYIYNAAPTPKAHETLQDGVEPSLKITDLSQMVCLHVRREGELMSLVTQLERRDGNGDTWWNFPQAWARNREMPLQGTLPDMVFIFHHPCLQLLFAAVNVSLLCCVLCLSAVEKVTGATTHNHMVNCYLFCFLTTSGFLVRQERETL